MVLILQTKFTKQSFTRSTFTKAYFVASERPTSTLTQKELNEISMILPYRKGKILQKCQFFMQNCQ